MNCRHCRKTALVLGSLFALATPAFAQSRAKMPLPVREITVFKDGHAFVLHSGRMPTDAAGNVTLDSLPTPVLGTFWPYANDKNAQLKAVTASVQKVGVTRTALTLYELLEANPGAQVTIVQQDKSRLDAQIVGVPQRELEPVAPGGRGSAGFASPFGSSVNGFSPSSDTVLLKTAQGSLALPMAQIKTVTFRGVYKRTVTNETFRNRLTLKLNWQPGKREKTANVGMVYLQKGLRWIPHYKISLDGKGNATVKLQATLINEMVDLKNVTANLVIGTPSFTMKDSPDPISLQQTFPELSRYFQADSQTGMAFSNAIMSQGGFGGGMGGMGGGGHSSLVRTRTACQRNPAQPAPIGNLTSDRNEDLFIFTVKNITLKKGESMVLPVAEFSLKYQDVYTLDIRPQDPEELDRNLSREQRRELLRLLRVPRAQHKIRLTNRSPYPLTTAPALIVNGNRVIAQTLMSYTTVGAEADLTLTVAGEIQTRKSEKEVKRTPNSYYWGNHNYDRVEVSGTLTITNFSEQAISLEVTRMLSGQALRVDKSGTFEMITEDGADEFGTMGVNGTSRFTWKRTLAAKESITLEYAYYYFTYNGL